MDLDLADELERFIELDALFDSGELDRCCARLSAGGDGSAAATLVHTFAGLRLRLDLGPVPERLRHDAEGVVYPRLWKVIEAVRDHLPPSEQRARAEVLNRRLAHLFAAEDAAENAAEDPAKDFA